MASNPIYLPGLQAWTLYIEVPGTLQAEENGSCMPALATDDILFGLLHFLSQWFPEQKNSMHIDHLYCLLDNGFNRILFRNYIFGIVFFLMRSRVFYLIKATESWSIQRWSYSRTVNFSFLSHSNSNLVSHVQILNLSLMCK